MDDNKRSWVAFVIGDNKELNKVVASFLSFDARNKFEALQQIEKSLPESENWVLSNGQVVPFRVLELHQCKPEETHKYMEAYVNAFADMMGVEPDFEGMWSKPNPDDQA